jgi:predicted molibdopterin-dependent oxidoreductase YjgC
MDVSVTQGHLCVKGRFGFAFVQERPRDGESARADDRSPSG